MPSVASSEQFAFADGGAGHVCTYTAGAPAVGDLDVLCVNSNTTVSTPTGFAASVSRVNSQGAYIFTRKAVGGESSSVTVTTSGNHNTQVLWTRISSANAADVTGSAGADGSSATSTPAFTSSALAASTELALAFAALHNWTGPTPTSPVWSAGYTPVIAGSQGGTTTGVYGAVAYKTPAGTAAESPSVSWTNAANDRYMLFVTFTEAGGGTGGVTVPARGTITVRDRSTVRTIDRSTVRVVDSSEVRVR